MLNFYQIRDKIKAYKNRRLRGFVKYLKEKNNLTSNKLSFLGLVCGLVAVYFLFENHQLFSLFIIFAILFDILDGALAKVEKKKQEGWIVDALMDRSLITIVLIKTAFYFSFKAVFPIIAIFVLVNLFIIYQRLVLKRNIEMLHGYHFLYVFYLFQFYKFGLVWLVASYVINFTLLLMQISKRFGKQNNHVTWANVISLFRPFLAFYALIQFKDQPIVAAALITFIILLDALDGIVARKMKQESEEGAFIDIICDRAVELIILFIYAYWGIISYLFPIVFAVRGVATDFLRLLNSIYKDAKFKRPLSIGKADNKFMRGFYAAVKLAAFSLILIFPKAGLILMVVALITNLYRGLPVIFSHRSKVLMQLFYKNITKKLSN